MRSLAIAAYFLVAGCGKTSRFVCETNAQCVSGGEQGICSAGSCAFPDGDCPNGYRFEPAAGGACTGDVDAGVDAVKACGGVGEACCAGGAACIGGASCGGGTCNACITDIALGRRFSCVLDVDHRVSCAGENRNGQLGTGVAGVSSATRMPVRDITTAFIDDAIAVGAATDFACAIRTGGTLWCWGNNNTGQIGYGTGGGTANAARQVVKAGNVPLDSIVEVTGGYNHACARDSTGGVWCWGKNTNGQLGDGTIMQRNVATPVLVALAGAPFSGAVELDTGGEYSCARKTNGEVWCWGKGIGIAGDNTATDKLSPVLVTTTTSFGAGQRHACYVNTDSTISCAGFGGHGHLANGNVGFYGNSDQLTYSRVQADATAVAFTGAAKLVIGSVSCVTKTDQSVWCWGDNNYGQSGNGEGSPYPAPVRAIDGTPLAGVDRLVADYAHACAHRATGEWLCWGRNLQGDLGDETFQNRGFPTPLKASCP